MIKTAVALFFSESEKRQIIDEFLKGGRTKAESWRQYTNYQQEHGQILRWMRKLGYIENTMPSKPLYLHEMPTNKSQPSVEDLQRKVRQLEQQLLDSQLKEEAYRRMIDIAEKELKVSIRKKPNTK